MYMGDLRTTVHSLLIGCGCRQDRERSPPTKKWRRAYIQRRIGLAESVIEMLPNILADALFLAAVDTGINRP